MITKTQELRNGEKETAAAIKETVTPVVVADFGRLELYGHDYHWLLARWLYDNKMTDADCEVEFFPTYATVNDRVFPYDVIEHGTERETLLVWVSSGKILGKS